MSTGPLFLPDDVLAARVRAVMVKLHARGLPDLAAELAPVAEVLDPQREAAA